MKQKINTLKVKDLLLKQDKTATELANYLHIPLPSISLALNGDRGISMDYVFAIAKFFKVKAISLTVSNDTKQKAS